MLLFLKHILGCWIQTQRTKRIERKTNVECYFHIYKWHFLRTYINLTRVALSYSRMKLTRVTTGVSLFNLWVLYTQLPMNNTPNDLSEIFSRNVECQNHWLYVVILENDKCSWWNVGRFSSEIANLHSNIHVEPICTNLSRSSTWCKSHAVLQLLWSFTYLTIKVYVIEWWCKKLSIIKYKRSSQYKSYLCV